MFISFKFIIEISGFQPVGHGTVFSGPQSICFVFIDDYAFVCFGKKFFTPDALPAATLPIYPGLGPASRDTEKCLRWLGCASNGWVFKNMEHFMILRVILAQRPC